MRRTLLLASILALFLIGAVPPVSLVRLTVVNKADMEIAIKLQSIEEELLVYYLRVPEGSKANPVAETFTIQRDAYHMQVYYIETYDPVYGFKCTTPPPNQLVAARNIRVTVLECGVNPPFPGEPTMWKYFSVPTKNVSSKCLPPPSIVGRVFKCWQLRVIY